MARFQRGYVYEASNAFHVRYWSTELRKGKAVRVQKSERLCPKDEKYHSAKSKPVQMLAAQVMQRVNALSGQPPKQEVTVGEFWDTTFFPFIEKTKKASTINGYKKLWKTHLSSAFVGLTLKAYKTSQATALLTSLADRGLGARSIAHVRSLGSAIFRHAKQLGFIDDNPWRDAGSLIPAKSTASTHAYTLEEAEAITTALIARADAQLAFALATFCGLRPGEISGLKWEDVESDWIHVRRSSWKGIVGKTKTDEAVASIPLIEPVRSMLSAWRTMQPDAVNGWVFENNAGEPMDMSSFASRVIVPLLKSKNIPWRGLYAGRRAAATLLVQLTGNAVAAQYILRHKNLSTTTAFYVKPVRDEAVSGMKALENFLKGRKALTVGAGD
jgi:integrase